MQTSSSNVYCGRLHEVDERVCAHIHTKEEGMKIIYLAISDGCGMMCSS
jgi:hypothetical protein